MPSYVVITLVDGTLVRGLNYRMDPGVAPTPSTPNSYTNGTYHLETAQGWVDVPGFSARQVSISEMRQT